MKYSCRRYLFSDKSTLRYSLFFVQHNIYIYNIYAPSAHGSSTQVGNLLATTYSKTHSSSHEFGTLVADDIYLKKICAKNSVGYTENVNGSGVRYMSDIRSAGFWSHFEASHRFSHTKELWYNKTVCLWMNIYIYIYIYIYI